MAQAGLLPCQLSKLLKRRESGCELTFADHVDQFDTGQGNSAEEKDSKPYMGLIRRLMNRWSCSMMSLRYFRLTI